MHIIASPQFILFVVALLGISHAAPSNPWSSLQVEPQNLNAQAKIATPLQPLSPLPPLPTDPSDPSDAAGGHKAWRNLRQKLKAVAQERREAKAQEELEAEVQKVKNEMRARRGSKFIPQLSSIAE